MHEVLDVARILQSLDSSCVIETEQSSKPIIYLETEQTSRIGFIRAIACNAQLQTEQTISNCSQCSIKNRATEQTNKQKKSGDLALS